MYLLPVPVTPHPHLPPGMRAAAPPAPCLPARCMSWWTPSPPTLHKTGALPGWGGQARAAGACARAEGVVPGAQPLPAGLPSSPSPAQLQPAWAFSLARRSPPSALPAPCSPAGWHPSPRPRWRSWRGMCRWRLRRWQRAGDAGGALVGHTSFFVCLFVQAFFSDLALHFFFVLFVPSSSLLQAVFPTDPADV